ncbi:hypothetical protein [Oryzihumus leptocrescens]|uniref:Uncharacterized protein n=1 Tax=Oryzihumus leptocrescens TaxID=297536 RepID=A0A542Z9D2_9MICO|nr:hypothetical protein [Oryzihumus leptocrescens]TQL56944.1 hypothetical protein FB474_3712 [Oryzihumus leptocrescens]
MASEDLALSALLRAVTAPATAGELRGQDDAIAAFLNHVSGRPPAPATRRRSRVAVPAVAAMVSVFALGGTAAAAMTGSLPAPLQDLAHHLTGVPAPSRDTGEAPGAPNGSVPRQHSGATVRHGPAATPAVRPIDPPSAPLPAPSARPTGRDGATDERGSVTSPTAGPRPTGSAGDQNEAHGSPTAHASGTGTSAGHTPVPPTGNDNGQGRSGATATRSPAGATPVPKSSHPAPPSQPLPHAGGTTTTAPGHGMGR